MKTGFTRKILAREFPIDAQPVPLPGPGAAGGRGSSRLSSKPDWVAASGESGAPEGGDLYGQVVSMLQEHERLERMARDLETRGRESDSQQMKRFFRQCLTVMDSFDRVLMMAEDHPPSEELRNWLKSVATIQSRMTQLCGEFGLHPMDPVGKPVDLDRHEVVEVHRTESLPDETVVAVRQKGYTLDGKVLRDARVVVAQNPSS